VAGWQGVWTRIGNTNEFDANFTIAFVLFTDTDHAAGLFLAGVGIAKDERLPDADTHGEMEQAAVGVDNRSERLLGDRLFVGTNGDDENSHAKQNALAAATIAHRREIGRQQAH